MHRRQFIRRVGTVAVAGIAVPFKARAAAKIVLGQSAAFTGPAAQLGIQMNAGTKLFFDGVNAAGGINGQQIELRTLDDGYEADRCKVNTEKFVKDSEVFALISYVGTPTSAAALPIINEAKIPFLGPFTGAEVLRVPFSRYVFHVRASYYNETARIVEQLATLGRTKIAVFYQNDNYGKAGLDGTVIALKKLNLEPVALGTVERNTVDVAQSIKDILPKQPDAVVQISAYKSCAAFIRAARNAGYGGSYYNVSFVGTAALAKELGAEDARGVVVSQVMPYPFAPISALANEFLTAVKTSKTPVDANYSSMEGYVVAKVMAEGLRRMGPTRSREGLIAALESINDMNLGGFWVDFSAKKHTASTFTEMTILRHDGKVTR